MAISCKAWNYPVYYRSWEYKFDVKESHVAMVNIGCSSRGLVIKLQACQGWWCWVRLVYVSSSVLGGHLSSDSKAYIWSWWRHQMGTFSALLVICAGNSPVTGEFPAQRPGTQSFDVFFICARINNWVNNREVGDLRRHRTHYDGTVMLRAKLFTNSKFTQIK